jgi:hypothetical protein
LWDDTRSGKRRLLLKGSSAYREKGLPDVVKEKIDKAISRNLGIIVGEAAGACRVFQDYLASEKYNDVKVGYARSIRYNAGKWETHKFGDNLPERERSMIEACDQAIIIWVNRSSQIASNLEYLKDLRKPTFIYEISYKTGRVRHGMLDPMRTYRRQYFGRRKSRDPQPSLEEFL